MRGEKSGVKTLKVYTPGSPPHTRGKEPFSDPGLLQERITPAYAGKSYTEMGGEAATGDHPRIRGEKHDKIYLPFHYLGSPPHTRGKAASIKEFLYGERITPAYAGKRYFRLTARRLDRDHPRIRGEKLSRQSPCHIRKGSPPHTRGKEHFTGGGIVVFGITPAYAGKRPFSDCDAGEW